MSRGAFFEVTRNLACRPLSLSETVVDRDPPVGIPGQKKPGKGPQAGLNARQESLVTNLVLGNRLLVSVNSLSHRLPPETDRRSRLTLYHFDQLFVRFSDDSWKTSPPRQRSDTHVTFGSMPWKDARGPDHAKRLQPLTGGNQKAITIELRIDILGPVTEADNRYGGIRDGLQVSAEIGLRP